MYKRQRLLFVSGRDKLEYYSKLKTLVPKEEWKSFLDAMMEETHFNEYFSFGANDEAAVSYTHLNWRHSMPTNFALRILMKFPTKWNTL